MIPASHIKKSIDFNKRFRSLLEVLKMIAVGQYYALERNLKTFEEFHQIRNEFFNSINVGEMRHPFLEGSDKPLGVVAVTSDAGLTGGMNMQVMSKAMDLIREHGGKLMVVGEKGQVYAQDSGYPFVAFPGIADAERYAQACAVRDYIFKQVLEGTVGPVSVVFFQAHSFVVHRVEVSSLLPIEAPKDAKKGAGLSSGEVLLESRPTGILEYLVYVSVASRLDDIFGMSRLAEQAARFTHLEESCQKLQEMNNKLLLQYFRRRHEMIDQNMRELFTSRSIYAK